MKLHKLHAHPAWSLHLAAHSPAETFLEEAKSFAARSSVDTVLIKLSLPWHRQSPKFKSKKIVKPILWFLFDAFFFRPGERKCTKRDTVSRTKREKREREREKSSGSYFFDGNQQGWN